MTTTLTDSGPFLVLPTRRGAVPYLTPDQLRKILAPAERLISVSVFDAREFEKPCTESGRGFADFCGLQGFGTFLSIRSSLQGPHATAPGTDNAIAGDHEKGRITVTLAQWASTVRAVQPALAVIPYESVPLSEPPNKRRRVSVARSEAWSNKLDEMDLNASTCTLIRVLGSGDSRGFIDAIPRNENTWEFAETLSSLRLPRDGVPTKSMCYAYSLPALLAAVVSGVQYVETALPWSLAEKGIALYVCLGHKEDAESSTDTLIDLNDTIYQLDISALSVGCGCFTCQRHCRAYIHHLLTVQEMNSVILLSIHNLTQLTGFIRSYRHGDSAERAKLVETVLAQL